MFFLFIFVFQICDLPVLVDSWSADNYWNGKYLANGISYTAVDAANGMWSDDGTPYLPHYWGGTSCSGCSCNSLTGVVGSCNSDTISISGWSIRSQINGSVFTDTVTSINFHGCAFHDIEEDAFFNKTHLTELTIQRSSLSIMLDVSQTQITKLNLIGNAITIDSRYKGSLPETIEYLALTNNRIHWLPKGFITGPKLRLVSLGGNAFVNFPVESLGVLPSIMYFGIESNQLSRISTNHLRLLSNTTFVHLNLTNNQIKYIQPGAFRTLHNLKILELHGNSLSSLPRGVFEGLSELVHLDLNHNKLEKLTSGAFKDLEKLIEFRIHSQSPPMTTIMFDSMINIGKSMKYMFISSNSLANIPHQVLMDGNFSSLIELHADRNLIQNVTELTESGYGPTLRSTFYEKKKKLVPFSTSPNIIYLYLQYNRISMVNNTDYCALQSLVYLNLEENRLNETHIQEEGFKCLPALTTLRLGKNYNMQYVPVALTTHARLPAIQYLYLENNRISVLYTNVFTNVSTLIYLGLRWNEIYIIEQDAFPGQLKDLDIRYNRIIAIENDAFPAGLQTLNLNYNKFRFIHEHQFADLKELHTLYLAYNEIIYIPDYAFKNATSLRNLYLNNNRITHIKKISFENCSSMHNLYLSNNEIGYIEDGTLSHLTTAGTIDLQNNRLYKLPMGGTFHGISISVLNLYNNRLSIIVGETFKDASISSLSLSSNRITTVESYAFQTVTCGSSLNLNNNKIRVIQTNALINSNVHSFNIESNLLGEIQSYSFNNTRISYFYGRSMDISIIPSYAFNDFISVSIHLEGNNIMDIEKHAFNNFQVSYFYLNNNDIRYLNTSIFGGSSSVYGLNMQNNQIESISSDAFENVALTYYMYFQNNKLSIYPTALTNLRPSYEINLSYNEITGIPSGSLINQHNLQRLFLQNNNIAQLAADSFISTSNLRILDVSSNKIQKVESGAFDGLVSLQTLNLHNNIIPYMPLVILPRIRYLYLSYNKIESLAGFILGGATINVNIDNNFLDCECATIESVLSIQNQLSSNTMCYSPSLVQGALFAVSRKGDSNHYLRFDKEWFQCSGESIGASDVSSSNFTLTWKRPEYLYFISNFTDASYEEANDTTNDKDTWEYHVTCTSDMAATLTKTDIIYIVCPTITVYTGNTTDNSTTNSTTVIESSCPSDHVGSVGFTSDDGVLPETLYECVIQLTVDNYTSAKSLPIFVTTSRRMIDAGDATGNETTSSLDLNVTYYDFSVGHDDFSSSSSMLSKSPYHVVSPLGNWLATSSDPTTDTFSDWFRSAASNTELQGGITLYYLDTTSSPMTRRFYSSSFFPIDNKGYGAEGQTDCAGFLHNFGFTSVIRTGITYKGSETITIGGGEEFWLFINKVLVLEVISNRTNGDVECQKIQLIQGSNSHISQSGVIVNGECVQLTSKPSSELNRDLTVGDTYLFELFHTERRICRSELFIELENVELSVDDNAPLPFDYHVAPKEDLHVNGLAGEFAAWDIFGVGPSYKIEILSGNEARHFTLKEDTTTNRNAATTIPPPIINFVYIPGTNISFVECDPVVTIPETSTTGTELFTLNTRQVLVTLTTVIDYEVKYSYNLVLRITDLGSGLSGRLILGIRIQDINDNCPVLTTVDYIVPNPILHTDLLFSVDSKDADSGVNAEVIIHISPVVLESPGIDYSDVSDIHREFYNETTNLILQLFGIDLGSPPRGTSVNVTVNISNTCLIDETFGRTNLTFSVNGNAGDVYLRVPGYWRYDFNCTDYIGIANGLIVDNQLTASSSRSILTLPNRARLNSSASDPVLGPLAGGWVAGVNDINQFIMVDLKEPYRIKQIHLQGQQDEPNWVTAFRIYFHDNATNAWTMYHNDNGEFIFLGNKDQNTIQTIDLIPPIVSKLFRINPRNWTNSIALRLEFSGCSLLRQFKYDTRCERCYTSYYCHGDGERHMCGRCPYGTEPCDRSPSEHSFGAQSECSTCPAGWICKEGYATPCKNHTYILGCNETFCPDNCSDCEPGYACRGGQRYQCLPGTYSDGSLQYCAICTEGFYQDLYGQSQCKQCPAGYYSGKSKDRCQPCDVGSYSSGSGSIGCIACTSITECPCMATDTCFEAVGMKAGCINKGSGSHECLGCPPGFTGDGVTCSDIDECALHQPCWNTSACINTVPGYQCLACPYGYRGTYEDGNALNDTVRVFELMNQELAPLQDQICVDIDECLTDNGGCDPLSPCVNTIGSFYCGYCAEGYAGIPSISCYSTDLCKTGRHSCSEHATCSYISPGEYKCECKTGFTGNGRFCGLDSDLDGHPDITIPCNDWGCYRDNCRLRPNCGQEDVDNDRIGDDCDDDMDNDGTINIIDNCPYVHSWNRADSDNDTVGDACDNCVSVVNADQKDTDKDGLGDECDMDDDNDGHNDVSDNCPKTPNPLQEDTDSDGVGDVCDNCNNTHNTAQTDTDQNGYGDSCDPTNHKDRDGDSILDIDDNCPFVANGDQSDNDKDTIGDVCDDDIDNDGVANDDDNCPYLYNPLQTDVNGDEVGDDCVVDSDGDGVDDSNDTCPFNNMLSQTSFSDYILVDLYPGYSNESSWRVKADGREVYQLADTKKPVMLIGKQTYGSIRYSGTFYVPEDKGENYIGFVFSYVSNRKFYLISWRPTNYNFDFDFKSGIRGVNIKVVHSNTGPGQTLADALWDSSSTTNQATVLWHDGNMTKWSNYTSYKWFLWHYTDLNKFRFQLFDVEHLMVDSGFIYDKSYNGGRVGVYQFGQNVNLWSDLQVECRRENMALYLDGIDNYVELTNISTLNIYRSFTIGIWVNIQAAELTKETMPLVCSERKKICLWLRYGLIFVSYSNSTLNSTTAVSSDEWINILYIYDESEYVMKIYIDGISSGELRDVEPIIFNNDNDDLLILGKHENNFFKGYVDEMVFYNVAIISSEINDHMHIPSITKNPTFHQYGQLYYKMDQEDGSSMLDNEGLLNVSSRIYGNAAFKESHQHFKRFTLEYPLN